MKCPYEGNNCECSGAVEDRRLNTEYHFEPCEHIYIDVGFATPNLVCSKCDKAQNEREFDPNMMLSCEAHYNDAYARYQEMWNDYWRDVL